MNTYTLFLKFILFCEKLVLKFSDIEIQIRFRFAMLIQLIRIYCQTFYPTQHEVLTLSTISINQLNSSHLSLKNISNDTKYQDKNLQITIIKLCFIFYNI